MWTVNIFSSRSRNIRPFKTSFSRYSTGVIISEVIYSSSENRFKISLTRVFFQACKIHLLPSSPESVAKKGIRISSIIHEMTAMGFEGPYQDLLPQALQLLSLVAIMGHFDPLRIGNFQPVTFYLTLGECVSGYVLQWPTLRGHSQPKYKKYYCFN